MRLCTAFFTQEEILISFELCFFNRDWTPMHIKSDVTVNIWQKKGKKRKKRTNLTGETWTKQKCFLTYISRNVLPPSKLQESLLPLLLPFFVIHMGDVYLIYQGARPTDVIKITALAFWPKYVYEADKRPFIYDGIGIKKASYSLCQETYYIVIP